MIRLCRVDEPSEIVLPLRVSDKRIVVLFPMTRGLKTNLARWQKLISTINNSEVSALVLIDKTLDFEATEFFSSQENSILCDIYILQRSRTEPIHDSQRQIRLSEGLWIIQLHDDDDWDGVLTLPSDIHSNQIVKTQFAIRTGSREIKVDDFTIPDCRSIFSLLPSQVWNHFIELINSQGGHVAGSIDSSLNLAVNLMHPTSCQKGFVYFYDDTNWNSRRKSSRHLLALTKQDGWGDFASVNTSLVARAVDGISSIIFFRSFYADVNCKIQIENWISKTKPRRMRIIVKRLRFFLLVSLHEIFKKFIRIFSEKLDARIDTLKASDLIVLKTWQATEFSEYISVVRTLQDCISDDNLQKRFVFWLSQLNYAQENIQLEKRV